MKALLINDIHSQKHHFIIMILFNLFFLYGTLAVEKHYNYFSTMNLVKIMNLAFSLIPYYSLKADENTAFLKLALTMPLSRSQFVHEKYLFGILTGFFQMILAVFIGTAALFRGLIGCEECWGLAISVFLGALTVQALAIPVKFQFSSDYSTIVMFVLYFMIPLILIFLMPLEFWMILGFFNAVSLKVLFSAPVVLALVLISWEISLSAFKKKDI